MGYKDPEAQRRYQREWMARRREEYLSDKSCAICGSTDRLEIDHVDRVTKVDHRIWSWTKVRRDKELEKCQILCQVHHREKTTSELRATEHGTAGMYQRKNKCRCELCRAWKKEENRIVREKRRSRLALVTQRTE